MGFEFDYVTIEGKKFGVQENVHQKFDMEKLQHFIQGKYLAVIQGSEMDGSGILKHHRFHLRKNALNWLKNEIRRAEESETTEFPRLFKWQAGAKGISLRGWLEETILAGI